MKSIDILLIFLLPVQTSVLRYGIGLEGNHRVIFYNSVMFSIVLEASVTIKVVYL